MQGIINFFSGIADSVITAFELLFAFIGDFISLLKLIGRLPSMLGNMIGWLPDSVMVSFAFLFGVVVLYKILGREG